VEQGEKRRSGKGKRKGKGKGKDIGRIR